MSEDPYSPEAIRAEFDRLGAEIKTIEETSPRLERDARADILTRSERKEFSTLIQAHEEGLFDKRQRYAQLGRLLKVARK